ncbi:MAG: hypothetical protein JEZ04_00790 [Spirochaetales bacterium]|nr:hypothetical protein [Spirochaetales bacterium]
MIEITMYAIIGILLVISIQLGILISRSGRAGFLNQASGPQASGPTVNVNIDRDGSIRKQREGEADISSADHRAEIEIKGQDEPEQSAESSETEESDIEDEEASAYEPSEDAIARREEQEKLSEELHKRNAKKHGGDQSAMASDKSSLSMQIVKCPDCGAENSAIRRNCFNCNKTL